MVDGDQPSPDMDPTGGGRGPQVDVVAPEASADGAPAPGRSLYRAVWRWHFYAGLFAIPVIVDRLPG